MTQASAGLEKKEIYYFLYILHKAVFGSFLFLNGHFAALLTNTAAQQRTLDRGHFMLEKLNYIVLVAQVFFGIFGIVQRLHPVPTDGAWLARRTGRGLFVPL